MAALIPDLTFCVNTVTRKTGKGTAAFYFATEAVEFKMGTGSDGGHQIGLGVLKVFWHFFGRTEPVSHIMLDNPFTFIDGGGTVFLVRIDEEHGGKRVAFPSQAKLLGLVNDLALLPCFPKAGDYELGEFVLGFVGEVHCGRFPEQKESDFLIGQFTAASRRDQSGVTVHSQAASAGL